MYYSLNNHRVRYLIREQGGREELPREGNVVLRRDRGTRIGELIREGDGREGSMRGYGEGQLTLSGL